MASICSRVVLQSRRNVVYSSVRFANKMMSDPIEHATGLEKRELCAKLAGNENPFDMKVLKRGPGTKDAPNLIPSAFDARIVGCICEEDATAVNWMWLNKGTPRRCDCGHWFKLIEKAPVQLEHLQSKYIGTGHADTTKFEWLVNQHRDSHASYMGHCDLLNYFAISENEAKARVRFNLMEKMLQPCGPPPEKPED